MGRMMGYARVSTSDQDVSLQWEALRRAGCQEPHIFCDTASGAHTARPGLEACLRALAPGDMLVVWRLDRLGKALPAFPLGCGEKAGRHGALLSANAPFLRPLKRGARPQASGPGVVAVCRLMNQGLTNSTRDVHYETTPRREGAA